MNALRIALCLLLFLTATASLMAQGTYTQIDVPGAVETFLVGINTAGDVVGAYHASDNIYHGFLLSGGVYTTIDYPGSNYNYLTSINDVGQIVGEHIDVNAGTAAGFVYDVQTATFTNIEYTGHQTYVEDINNIGTIVGSIYFTHGNSSVPLGFRLVGGNFEKTLPQGFAQSDVGAINNSGEGIVLASHRSGPFHNFLFQNGHFQQISLPVPQPAGISGINDSNTLVGSYGSGVQITTGFVYQNGMFRSLTFPGATYTIASHINNGGEVVGYFFDSSLLEHGFTWTPPADAPKR